MVRLFNATLAKWRRDIAGTTAVIWALCLLPIMLLIGFSLDGSRLTSTDRHAQAAMDAAVLAGAKAWLHNADLDESARAALAKQTVEDFYMTDMATARSDLGGSVLDVTVATNGTVDAKARTNVPLIFGGLFGRPSADVNVASGAQAGDSRKVEVILALDNTTSMFEAGRFTKMREASKGFVNTMFDQTPSEGLMSVGVVPWASVVNINSERPGTWNADAAPGGTPPVYGSGKTPNAAFENRRKYLYEPEAETPYTAAAMAEDFAPVDWRGCIRSAPNERRASAGGNVNGRLTDSAPGGMRWHASWLEPELQTWWVPPPGWKPNPNPKPGKPQPPKPPVPGPQGNLQPDLLLPGVMPVQQASLEIPSNRRLQCTQNDLQGGNEGARNVYLNKTQPCAKNWKDDFNGTAKACVSDPTEFGYFNSGEKACEWQDDIFPWTDYKAVSGPNMNCPTAMLGLSGDRGQIIEKLNHMYPVQGGTQADIGLMWGLRALSSRNTWTNFFGTSGASDPRDFDDPTVRKIMILLTDGKNEAPYHYEGYYGCAEGNSRGAAGECWKAKGVSNATRDALDGLTLDSCEAIREDYGIELYTIAVDISDGDAISLLADCANDEDRTFNITSSELDTTFDAIAARELRLTK